MHLCDWEELYPPHIVDKIPDSYYDSFDNYNEALYLVDWIEAVYDIAHTVAKFNDIYYVVTRESVAKSVPGADHLSTNGTPPVDDKDDGSK